MKVKKKEIKILRDKIDLLKKQIDCKHQFALQHIYHYPNCDERIGYFVCIKCRKHKERSLTQKEINAAQTLGWQVNV